MKTFLFQGDSITDADRRRGDDSNYGFGYPNLFASEYLGNEPGEFKFIDRAIGGNRVVDVYARIKCDFINLKPDYISILVGVNDVWHELGNNRNGISDTKFEVIYSMLIEEIKEALPATKIFILEPYVLKGLATEGEWGYFRPEVELRAQAAKRVAEKYGLVFVPLQKKLDDASEKIGTAYWAVDGVHPTAAGHQLIKTALKEAFEANR